VNVRNAALFAVLAVAWGSAFTAIKAGLDYFPPVLFAALRYDFAGVLVLGYAVYATDRWRPRTRPEWLQVLAGGSLMIAAYHAFLFVGEQGTTSAVAAIVVSLSPVLTTAFARAFLPDERLTVVGTIGLVIGFLGVVLLSRPDPNNLLDTRTLSMALVFTAAAAFALGSVLTRRIDADLPIEPMEAWSMLLGAVLMHGVSLAIGESVADIRWTTEALLALGYLVVVASALGFLIYFDLLDRLGPIEINLVSYAAPVAAALAGWLVLDETLAPLDAVAFLTIFAGFALLKRRALADELAPVGRRLRRALADR